MTTFTKITISLPPELAREAEGLARAEGKTLSDVVQGVLRAGRTNRLKSKLLGIQGFWSRKAKAKGVLSEKNLARYLAT